MTLIHKLKYHISSLISLPIVFRQLIKIFKVTAMTGKGSDLCLKYGFLPLPIHFHSPVPDIGDLEDRDTWNVRSELTGIDFRENGQIELLGILGRGYSHECQWPLLPTSDETDYYVQNVSFSYGCAASTHCMIRHHKPSTVVEIGSGMSSRVVANALAMNRDEHSDYSEYIIVDPYPADFVRSGLIEVKQLVENRVELLDPSFFDLLDDNDILFIDSGHCVRIGGDVNYLFLDVLPRLNPGVIVHVHDIGLPYEYPKTYFTSESFRQFWTEQYLLQAFLSFNSEYEILLAMNYLMKDHFEDFKELFPHYDPSVHLLTSSSFWMRCKKREKHTA
jgi:hypothetical protein